MPVNVRFNFNVKFPKIPKDSKPPEMSIGPAPELLQIQGPNIDVLISVTDEHAQYLQDNGMPIPQPVAGKALIDTGASVSVLDVEVLKKLGVNPVGMCKVGTPQGSDLQEKYPAKISFPGTGLINIQSVSILGSPAIGNQGLIALIGRDILRYWLLIYDGTSGNVTIAS